MSAWRHISLWMNQLDDDLVPRPSLQGTLDVDVAIAGAGYTGLWTAYYLKLRAPQLTIAIVEAETAGFNSLSAFYRCFRQQTGQSPREYLKRLREEQAEA